MGSASSVSLTLDEARRRLGPDECNRFDEGFKRILHSQQDGLSLGLFISTFVAELSPTCPRNLAPAIFRAFNASKSGILTRDELIVGLCIIRTGTVEERLELVFHAANEQQNGRLVEFELRNYLALLDDNSLLAQSSLLFVRRGYASLREWVELTQECLGGGDIDALLGWVVELDHALGGRSPLPPASAALPTTPVVLRSRKWSIDGTPPPSPQLGPPSRTPPASPILSSLPTTPRSRSSSWAGGKHSPPPSSSALRHLDFSSEGLSALRELFTKCREQSESGAVDLAALQTAFARSESAVPPPLVKAIFERLDEDGDGVVDIRDFVGGLCCCFGGGVEEKLEFCFSLFAHAEPSSVCSVLGKEGMGLLLKSLWSVEAIHSTCALEEGGMEEWSDDDGDWPGTRLPPVLVLQRQTSSSPEVLASINDLVDRAMAAFSSDGSGGGGGGSSNGRVLTLKQFTAWAGGSGSSAKTTPEKSNNSDGALFDLSSSLTERLERATFVDVGIRPSDAATELRLVRALLLEAAPTWSPLFDATAPGPKGTVWCVVDQTWLSSWCDSVGIDSFRRILQPAQTPPTATQGSSPSLPPQKRPRKFLPQLDNRALVDSWGQLLPTVFHRQQFELVSVEVVRALTAWYGDSTGGLLERRVISVDNKGSAGHDGTGGGDGGGADTSGCVMLELFPPLVTVTLEAASTAAASQQPVCTSWVASSGDTVATLVGVAAEQFCLGWGQEKAPAFRLWHSSEAVPEAGAGAAWELVTDEDHRRHRRRSSTKRRSGDGIAMRDGDDDTDDDTDEDDVPPPPRTLRTLCDVISGEQRPHFLLEVRGPTDGQWPRGDQATLPTFGSHPLALATSSLSSSPLAAASPVKRARVEALYNGAAFCGLANLGNTCYLNAALQALRHTRLFCDYFAQQQQHRDIRTTAPDRAGKQRAPSQSSLNAESLGNDPFDAVKEAARREEDSLKSSLVTTSSLSRAVGGGGSGDNNELQGLGKSLNAESTQDEAPPPLFFPYQYDLNTTSKWGARGKIAVALSDLFVQMRATEEEVAAASAASGAASSVVVRPADLKAQLAAFDPMFGGYEQQDASEALAKILEGVGEDVSRLTGCGDKPYTELPDSNGRADEEVASEWWGAHEARERHVVTALLTGQLKVTTTCQATQAVSTTFEQFVSLTVPLPEDTRLFFTVVVVFSAAATSALLPSSTTSSTSKLGTARSAPGAAAAAAASSSSKRRPLRCTVAVAQDGTVATLLSAVADLVNGTTSGCNCEDEGGGGGGGVGSGGGSNGTAAEDMVAAYVGAEHFITSVLGQDKALSLLRPEAVLHVFRVGSPPLPQPTPLTEGDKVEVWSGLSWRRAVVSRGAVLKAELEHTPVSSFLGQRIENAAAVVVKESEVKEMAKVVVVAVESEVVVECRDDDNGTVWTASPAEGSVRRLRDSPALVLVCLRVQVSVDRFFVNPLRCELFGLPFVFRVVPDLTTGEDLYSAVWAHVGSLFDTLEEAPRSREKHGKFKFNIRRVLTGSLGRQQQQQHESVQSATSSAGNPCAPNRLLLPGGKLLPASSAPLDVEDEEVLLVDFPSEWLACFNRRAASFVGEDPSVRLVREERGRPVDLVQCLRSLCEPEEVKAYSPELTRLKGGEYSESVQAKCSQLWRPPPVLVVSLKRFRVTPSKHKHKLSTPVTFPLQGLDLSEFMDPSQGGFDEKGGGEALYDLVAVVNHIGSLGGGHYTCFARRQHEVCRGMGDKTGDGPITSGDGNGDNRESRGSSSWALFDDSRVAAVDDLERIVSPQAYVLVYELRQTASKCVSDVYPVPAGSVPVDPASVRKATWRPPSLESGVDFARRKSRAASCRLM